MSKSGGAFKLLLVEDNPGDADLARERLADLPGYDFEITQASRLSEAEALLLASPVDAVILDLNLPDSQGLETLRRLRRIRREMTIIVLSGFSDEGLRQDALREGAQEFLSKSEPASRLVARSFLYAMERHRILAEHEQVERLVAANPDAVIVVDKQRIVRFANKAALALFGAAEEDFISAPFAYPFSETAVSQIEFVKSDKTHTAEIRAAEIDWAGQPAFLASIRDITEQKSLTEQLVQSQKLEAMGLLAGGVAHDFNNLLTVVVNCANFLIDETAPDDPRVHDIKQILGAADRGEALVSQLLALTRRRPSQPQILDMAEAVRVMQPLLRRTLPANIEITLSANPGLWPVLVDRGRLDQVLMNLSVNAKDAMQDGGKLSIALANESLPKTASHEAGDYLALKISDTGCGIAPDTIGRIFDPFFTTKAPGKGTGLGLATCYAILRQAGGDISVDSTPGQGTCFTLLLPRAKGHATGVSGPDNAVENLKGTETLLVVEDDAAVLDTLTTLLSKNGYTVLSATNGESALRIAREYGNKIELVLSDVVMPGMNGHDLARNLKAMRPDLKIVLMTGYDSVNTNGDGGEDENVLDTVFKPFKPVDMLRKLKRACGIVKAA